MTDKIRPTTYTELSTNGQFEIERAPTLYKAEVAQAVMLVESGDLALAAKVCLPIWQRRRYGDDGPFMLGDDPESPYRIGDEDQIPWEVPYILGTAYLKSGDLDRAEFFFEWLWRVLPALPEGLYMLGVVAIARGEDSKAAQILRRLLTRNPAHAEGHRELGEALLRLGQTHDAIIHFGHSLALQPDNSPLAKRFEEVKNEFKPEEFAIQQSPATAPGKKCVVFVADLLRWREARMAAALRSLGWKVVLLFRGAAPYQPLRYFDDYRFCKSVSEFIYYSRQFDADIFHVFCTLNYDVSTALRLNGIRPIVVDCYDQHEGMFRDSFYDALPQYLEQAPLERFSLEHADGLCCRNLMLQQAKQTYKISAPTLFYPEYCWNSDSFLAAEKLHDRDGELHVVHGGSIVLKTKEGEYTFDSYRWLAEILIENKIHYHTYPTIDPGELEDLRNDFTQLQRESPYFHFHEPVFGDDWLTELSQYDVGIAFSFQDEERQKCLLAISTAQVGISTSSAQDLYHLCSRDRVNLRDSVVQRHLTGVQSLCLVPKKQTLHR